MSLLRDGVPSRRAFLHRAGLLNRLVLAASPDYWGGRIDASQVVFKAIPEVAPRIAALFRGEVDLITKLPPDHVERVAKNPTTKVEGALYAGLYALIVDSRRPALDNPKVKQALSLAIDREAIVRDLWRGQGIVPNGPIPKGDNYYDESLPPLKYDPALARQRLRDGGYQNEPIYLESSTLTAKLSGGRDWSPLRPSDARGKLFRLLDVPRVEPEQDHGAFPAPLLLDVHGRGVSGEQGGGEGVAQLLGVSVADLRRQQRLPPLVVAPPLPRLLARLYTAARPPAGC